MRSLSPPLPDRIVLPQRLARELSLSPLGVPVRRMVHDFLVRILGVDFPESGADYFATCIGIDYLLPVTCWVGNVPLPKSRRGLLNSRFVVRCADFVQRAKESIQVLHRILVRLPHTADDLREVSFVDRVEFEWHFFF